MAPTRRGWKIPELAVMYDIDPSWLYKAVRQGRLRKIPNLNTIVRISEGERLRFFGPDEPEVAA